MVAEVKISNPHENQKYILDNAKRFNVIQCGRRFGKSELIKELSLVTLDQTRFDRENNKYVGKKIGVYFPIREDLLDIWQKLKITYKDIIKEKNETYRWLELVTGGVIKFWSMDEPDSSRGQDYDRVIVDEAAKAKKLKEAWGETIRATLIDRKGDAFFLSTPKGKHNYFFELKERHKSYDNWASFVFTSFDNPHISPEELKEFEQYDELTYRQEVLAEDVDKNEKPYLYCYDETKHFGFENKIDPELPVWFSFDFNVDPMTCIVSQRKDILRSDIIDEVRLNSSDIYEMTDYLTAKYRDYIRDCYATGDASGKNNSGMVRGKINYWKIIKQQLNLHNEQIRLRKKNLPHEKSRPLVNSVLQNADIRVNSNCKQLNADLKYSAVDEYGQVIKTSMEGRHFFDTFRYLIDANYPDFLNNFKKYKQRAA